MIGQLQKAIENADKILIGIGNEFQEKYEGLNNEVFIQFEKEAPLLAGYQKINYLQEHKNVHVINAYQNLYEMVKEKDYFIISTCTDDRIYDVDFSGEKVVTPCGGFRFVQCSDNCKEELLPVTEEMIEERQKIVCPHCSQPACFNQIFAPVYNENGYLEQWNAYRKWLQSTVNRKLCILELGVEMDFPSVIRWPFEKIITYNQKAVLFRVNETLFQLPKEINEKGHSIKENAVDFLKNKIEL